MRPPDLQALGVMRPLGAWGPGAIYTAHSWQPCIYAYLKQNVTLLLSACSELLEWLSALSIFVAR